MIEFRLRWLGCHRLSRTEADDSPGGVLIGIVVVIGAVVLGVMALQRTRRQPPV